jgi:phage anti-repressor protein
MDQQIVPKTVNFKELIKNGNNTLSFEFQTKFVDTLSKEFTNEEQKWYIANFYVYMNYHPTNDFPINLEHVFKMIGFAHKKNAKRTLENNFTENEDYKIVLLPREKNLQGGRPEEAIMLNVDTFKNLCMIAKTDKGKQIRKYYVKLENIYNQIIKEEIEEEKKKHELKIQQQQQLLIEHQEQSQVKQDILREKTILEQFPKNKQCIYYGIIDHVDGNGVPLIKFGMSNYLSTRVDQHKKTYKNFRLTCAFKVSNHIEIENEIKNHPILKKRRRNIIYNDKNHIELLAYDVNETGAYSLENINRMIKDIITEREYNLENYNKLLNQNKSLNNDIKQLEEINEQQKQEIIQLKADLEIYRPKVSVEERVANKKRQTISDHTKCSYILYAFECKDFRYIHGLSRFGDLENRINLHKASYPGGELKYKVEVKYPFIDKLVSFIVKRRLQDIGQNTIECSLEDIKCVFDICSILENILLTSDIYEIRDTLKSFDTILSQNEVISDDAGVPSVHKARRPVDQINKDTGAIVASYPTLEAAGKAIGVTGTAVGIALRNKSLCKGFIFRYAGISPEEQYKDQPVVKICCSTGAKTRFPNIAAAALDCNVSSPGLRNRILTKVHRDGFHWIWA